MSEEKQGNQEKRDDIKLIERALKVGLGFITLGEEKLSELAGKLARRGEAYASGENSPVSRLVESMSEKGGALKEKGGELRERGVEVAEKITVELKEALKKINFATKAELDKLRQEVEELKKSKDIDG